jgi:hypothetical protein
MRDVYVAVSILAALALSTPSWADTTPSPTASATPTAPVSPTGAANPAAAQAKSPEEAKRMARDAEIVCFNDLDTGSHLRRTRVCMTRAQRDQRQKEAGDAMDAIKEAGRTPFPCMPGTSGSPVAGC